MTEGKDLVKVEKRGHRRILWMMNEPDNRFNRDFVAALNRAFDEIEADGEAKSVVITSAQEKFFSNGLDLAWMASRPREEWKPFLISFGFLLRRAFLFPRPLAAAINGHAFAGGMFFAMTADLRVMREDRGWLCVPEVDLGVQLPPGYVEILAHAAGRRQADLLSLSGRRVTAQEALSLGLVDGIASKDELLDKTFKLLEPYEKKPTASYAAIKLNLRGRAGRVLQEEDPAFLDTYLSTESGLSKAAGG